MSGTVPQILQATETAIARAAAIVRAGGLVAFPSETVYGLGADATQDSAVAAIFAAKGRPQFNPLIVHVAEPAEAWRLGEANPQAERLAARFWPGPLTLVLKRRHGCPVSLLASAGLETIALRCPDHPVAQRLLRVAAVPLAAPSANRSGSLSPTAPAHVAASLGAAVPLILAAGRCPVGIESTVVALGMGAPTLLRPGSVTRAELEAVLGPVGIAGSEDHAPRSPGQLSSHYAPERPLRLEVATVAADEALLAFGPDALIRGGRMRCNLSPEGDLHMAAANLFAMLRQLDHPDHRAIAVMPIPETGLGLAINDRLRRAAAPRP